MLAAMDEARASTALAALGHQARLGIFRLLVRAGPDGLNIGEIGAHLSLAPSTLAHHLSTLVQAGLVIQEKRGREVRNRIDRAAIDQVMNFVLEACCCGLPQLATEQAG